jgi:pimeloyl-ACP methyl ester carboxylesterase
MRDSVRGRLPVKAGVSAMAFVSGLMLACAPQAAAGAAAGDFVGKPCPASLRSDANLAFQCGELHVREVPDSPASALLTIPVTIMIPKGAPPDPVIMLHGGPGVPAHDNARARFAKLPTAAVAGLLGGRTWILFDQRGVGLSSPPLNCPLPKSLVTGYTPAEAKACAGTLKAQGRALDAYNSVTSAGDVEALRLALGYDKINLVGASYGSRLAFTYARLYPDHLRAIVHDGPYSPAEQETVDDARGVDRILRGIARRCAASAPCAKRLPDLENRFVAGIARLAKQPVKGVDDSYAVQEIRGAAFDHRPADALAMMDRIARGDTSSFAARLKEASGIDTAKLSFPSGDRQAFGQTWSVDCNEENSFESKAEYAAARGTSPLIDAFLKHADDNVDICQVWPSGKADPIESQQVKVAVPQLILTGEFDASQSGFVGARIAAAMPDARDMVFTDTGHVQIIGPKAECAFGVIARFLDDLDPRAPTPACVGAAIVRWR